MDQINMPVSQTIEFKSDRYTLTGTLHLPDKKQAPFVIGCHGLLADRSSPKQMSLADACIQQGIAYFRFDHRGCGDSEGTFESVTSLEGRRRDLLSAIRLIRSLEICNGEIGLFGSSLGGTVCLAVAGAESVACTVTFAAPLHNRSLHSVGPQLRLSFDITPIVRRVNNLHIFHGELDTVVPLSHAETLYAHAARPKRMTVLPGGDHRMSDPRHQTAFIRESVDWFNKFCAAKSIGRAC